MKFWDVVKEISAQPVRQEASRLFVLALAGEAGQVELAREAVLAGASPEERIEAEQFLVCASPPYSEEEEKRLRHSDLIVSLPGGPAPTDLRPADTIQLSVPEEIPARAIERRPDLLVAFARRLPGFRQAAAEQVIRKVSRVNAEFAAVSGISQSIPFLAPLFPAVVGTDIFILTKNQVLMLFRLAAIYGEDLELRARAREALAIIGGAFGWRTLARQVLGVLPGGVGIPVRVGIAYSGTYAVGRAAQMVFDQGRRPTRKEMRRIYEEGRQLAAGVVTAIKERRRKGQEPLEETPALPEELEAPAPDLSPELSPDLSRESRKEPELDR